jgi:4-hydroxythreonine-4-phosphate dehydrogenase
MTTPIIGLGMGDPAGIGPELVLKALSDERLRGHYRPVILGHMEVFRSAHAISGVNVGLRQVQEISEARFAWPSVDLIQPSGLELGSIEMGRVGRLGGEAAAQCLRAAMELAAAGEIHGLVSAPLNKEAFHLADYDFFDELGYMADITGQVDAYMMGVVDPLWTISVTEHVPFREIVPMLSPQRVGLYIRRMDGALRRAGVARQRIAVAALNPHGGEGGLFGDEEASVIGPAIESAKGDGIDVYGPVPADTVFVRALGGEFDGVVFMYHDQANIARKLQPWDRGVTVFMGLPVPVTTTAHGTAFDIVGQGIADPGSMCQALRTVIQLVSRQP